MTSFQGLDVRMIDVAIGGALHRKKVLERADADGHAPDLPQRFRQP